MNKTLSFGLRLLLVALSVATVLPAPALARTAAARESAPATLDACSWDRPGRDPFMGDVVAAVDRYQDIPAEVRARLKDRMAKRQYDDVVSIRRDSIAGQAKKSRYGSTIRDMHFGNSRLCHSVSRAAWSKEMQERGLVYCESGQCILVPTVCRNVSRIARAEVAHERAEGEPEPGALAVAMIDADPLPLPIDLLPAPFELEPVAGPPAGADGFAGFGGGYGILGGVGSFATATGAGSSIAAMTAPDGKGGFGHVSQAPSSPEVTGTVAAVPEPGTWGLMIAGLAAVVARRRRRA